MVLLVVVGGVQIFHNNLRLINAINRQRKSYSAALNHWADLTGEERRARFALGTRPPPKEVGRRRFM